MEKNFNLQKRIYPNLARLMTLAPVLFFEKCKFFRKSMVKDEKFDVSIFDYEFLNFIENDIGLLREETDKKGNKVMMPVDILNNLTIFNQLRVKTLDYYENEYDPCEFMCENVKPNQERFLNLCKKLFAKLTKDELVLFTCWIWQAVRTIKGEKVKFPLFLGLSGKMGIGKDTVLRCFQKACGCRTTAFNMFDMLNSSFSTKEIMQSGIVRFEEITARKHADIEKLNSLITATDLQLNIKYKRQTNITPKNIYCGTSNDGFDYLVIRNENRRIVNINWQRLDISLDEEEDICREIINSCPYEEHLFKEDEIDKLVRNQKTINKYTQQKLDEYNNSFDRDNQKFLTIILAHDKLTVGTIQGITGCSRAEAAKFLSDELFFTKVSPTSRFYNADRYAIDEFLKGCPVEEIQERKKLAVV